MMSPTMGTELAAEFAVLGLSQLLRFGVGLICLAGLAACEQSEFAGGGNEDKGDLIDQAPQGATSFGVELALINQFGFALWSEGAFKAAFDESIIEDRLNSDLRFLRSVNLWLDLTGEARLPPVVDTTANGLVLSIGELHVSLLGGTDLGQLSATAVIAIRTEIEIGVKDGAFVLEPHFRDEDLQIDLKINSFAGLQSEAVERIVQGIAPSFLRSQLDKLSTLPIPNLNLQSPGGDRVLGLNQANLQLSPDGLILQGRLGDIDASALVQSTSRPAPIEESAPSLAACSAASTAEPGLEGDCCFADDGSEGVCTNLDPDGDGSEEAFCPTGMVALRSKCPSAPSRVKCCIYP